MSAGTVESGWYIARRREWPSETKPVVVRVALDAEGGVTTVWQIGSRDPAPLSDWRLDAKVLSNGHVREDGLAAERIRAEAHAAGFEAGRTEALDYLEGLRDDERRNVVKLEVGRHHAVIDLMTDALRFGADRPITRIVTIVVADGFRVIEDGRIAEALAFDEMLGQIVTLLHPDIKAPRYGMLDRNDLYREAERNRVRAQERKGESA